MKKLLSCLMAFALPLTATAASGVEVKISGDMDIVFESFTNFQTGTPFQSTRDGGTHQKHFSAVQTMGINLDFIVSESLSAHYRAEVGTFTWGGPATNVYDFGSGNSNSATGGALGSRASNMVTQEAFLTWIVPNTDVTVRMGQQRIALPSYAFANPVLANWGTGIVISSPITDSININAFWMRAYSDTRRGTPTLAGQSSNDTLDVGALSAELRLTPNDRDIRISPWIMAGKLGKDAVNASHDFYNSAFIGQGLLPLTTYTRWESGPNGVTSAGYTPSDSTLVFAGMSAMLADGPFRTAIDAYWSASRNQFASTERSGWYLGSSTSYTTNYGVPTFNIWYASGDDSNLANGSERPLSLRSSFSPGASVAFNTFGQSNAETMCKGDPAGTWGISAQWNKIRVLTLLDHSLRITWIQGTNSTGMAPYALAEGPARYMTTKDSLLEIDLDTEYPIYPNLTVKLELSYLIPNFDSRVWSDLAHNGDPKFSNAYRAALGLTYLF